MVERRSELRRRQTRRKKMFKLKAKLAAAKDPHAKELVLNKIHLLSPWWKEPGSPATPPAPPRPASKPTKTKG